MKEMEEKTLATELIQESKRNALRWYNIAKMEFIIFSILIVFIISIFIWYINQPTEEITTDYIQDAQTSGENSSINQNIGE